jgi:predicted transcriptional regulator
MAMKWNELKHKASPEKRERLKQQALEELAAVERTGVGIIRAARHQTQVAVAEQMNIPQSAVSRLEAQRDCRLSTLRKYVAALGGHLEMKAVFPDDTVDLDRLMSSVTELSA